MKRAAQRYDSVVSAAVVALFPPRSSRVAALAVGGGAAVAVVTAGLAVGQALPAMRVFAVTFVALVGAWTTLSVARPRRGGDAALGPAIPAAGLAGVAASASRPRCGPPCSACC